jgi:hypothetical protein
MATLLPNDQVGRDVLKGYRVFIWSHDHPHPAHVHFGKGSRVSSWDLATADCEDEDGFSSSEIRVQARILEEFRDVIWDSWHEHWQNQPPQRRR